MATLHVRNVPEKFYDRLKRLAAERNRSLSAEVLDLLERALGEEERRRQSAEALARLTAMRRRLKPAPGEPDSTQLIREDRDSGHRDG